MEKLSQGQDFGLRKFKSLSGFKFTFSLACEVAAVGCFIASAWFYGEMMSLQNVSIFLKFGGSGGLSSFEAGGGLFFWTGSGQISMVFARGEYPFDLARFLSLQPQIVTLENFGFRFVELSTLPLLFVRFGRLGGRSVSGMATYWSTRLWSSWLGCVARGYNNHGIRISAITTFAVSFSWLTAAFASWDVFLAILHATGKTLVLLPLAPFFHLGANGATFDLTFLLLLVISFLSAWIGFSSFWRAVQVSSIPMILLPAFIGLFDPREFNIEFASYIVKQYFPWLTNEVLLIGSSAVFAASSLTIWRRGHKAGHEQGAFT